MTGVVHGFEDDCPQCAAARLVAARRWEPLQRALQWLAFAELVAVLAGCFLPVANATLFACAWLGIAAMMRCARDDWRRLRTARQQRQALAPP